MRIKINLIVILGAAVLILSFQNCGSSFDDNYVSSEGDIQTTYTKIYEKLLLPNDTSGALLGLKTCETNRVAKIFDPTYLSDQSYAESEPPLPLRYYYQETETSEIYLIKNGDPYETEGVVLPLIPEKTIINGIVAYDEIYFYYRGEVIEGIDTKSIQLHRNRYGELYFYDKNNVYYNGKLIEGFHAGSLQFHNCGYVSDKDNVYAIRQGLKKIIAGADPNDFDPEANGCLYAKSKNNYFFKGYKADVPTACQSNGYYLDKNSLIYFYDIQGSAFSGRKIEDVDTSNITILYIAGKYSNRSHYLTDGQSIIYGTQKLPNQNGDELIQINEGWFRLGSNLVYGSATIPNVDFETFEIIEGSPGFAFDKNNVYTNSPVGVLEGADSTSFGVYPNYGASLAFDKDKVYCKYFSKEASRYIWTTVDEDPANFDPQNPINKYYSNKCGTVTE